MYNRYVPQPDGTFRRSRIEEPEIISAISEPPKAPPESIPEPVQKVTDESNHRNTRPHPQRQWNAPRRAPVRYEPMHSGSVTGFLRQLIPQGFDTEDLIVVLLLLLMSGDSQEEQNTALLTLVIYLFL